MSKPDHPIKIKTIFLSSSFASAVIDHQLQQITFFLNMLCILNYIIFYFQNYFVGATNTYSKRTIERNIHVAHS